MEEEDPSFDILVVTCDGEVILFNGSNFPHELGRVKYAIGSGAEFALGAMFGGMTAPQAVLIANQLDTGSGLGVDSASFAAPKTKAKRPSKKATNDR